jgi:hypothetical protein
VQQIDGEVWILILLIQIWGGLSHPAPNRTPFSTFLSLLTLQLPRFG